MQRFTDSWWIMIVDLETRRMTVDGAEWVDRVVGGVDWFGSVCRCQLVEKSQWSCINDIAAL